MEIILSLAVLAVTIFLFFYVMSGPPYLPSRVEKVEKAVEISKVKPGMKVVDLGSGDGRIVIAFAKKGAEAHGYEINPALVWLSRRNIKKSGLEGKAFIHTASFWKQNFSDFDVIVIYGISHIMNRLQRKLQKELKPGARVIACLFPFKKWEPVKKEDGVYLYVI